MASLILAVYVGLEVQAAVGLKPDVDGMSRVLDSLFAEFLPEAERGHSRVRPATGKPSAARRSGATPARSGAR